jgi:hypothetical protein
LKRVSCTAILRVVHETDLHLEPNEASDLCPLESRALLERRGWDRAFVTVLDEASAEASLAVLGHDAGASAGDGWHAVRVAARAASGAGKTEDAEACARRDGWVYALGSQFGSKAGPLAAGRSWIARVREGAFAEDEPELEIARLRFGLHRAVNDALLRSGVELIARGPCTTERYIDATIARGAAKSKRWAGRVSAADHPINVEGAEFRANGRLVLGLRYPVSAGGHPLLIEVDDVEALFASPDEVPACSNVWELEGVGDRSAPMGVRGLHTDGDDRFDAIVGDLDAAGKGATILADHPEGGRAPSLHVRFSLPLTAGGGAVSSELVHDFGQIRRVEGIALAPDGHAHYVIDEEGHVALRTLLLE